MGVMVGVGVAVGPDVGAGLSLQALRTTETVRTVTNASPVSMVRSVLRCSRATPSISSKWRELSLGVSQAPLPSLMFDWQT